MKRVEEKACRRIRPMGQPSLQMNVVINERGLVT
jgi:hypothetical protein